MNILTSDIDPLGTAVKDYSTAAIDEDIIVKSNIAVDDVIPVSYLFRRIEEMPKLEIEALQLCSGKVLDVGAAAGCHSIVLQEKGFDITALEISELCSSVMKKRGISNVICDDFYRYEGDNFDTLLMLMNGIGIAGTIRGLENLLKKAGSLLNPGGKIIFDSSDIEYLYIYEDGSKLVNLNSNYYGELIYTMHYKSVQGKSFPWLFIDYKTLAPIVQKNGFEPQLIATGDHYDYLGILKKKV
jgi:precorrin-6B methylase 2